MLAVDVNKRNMWSGKEVARVTKVKILRAWTSKNLEYAINYFLEENEDQIEVIDIKALGFFEESAMIIYKEK